MSNMIELDKALSGLKLSNEEAENLRGKISPDSIVKLIRSENSKKEKLFL